MIGAPMSMPVAVSGNAMLSTLCDFVVLCELKLEDRFIDKA